MRPEQERRPTVREANDPKGARPRMGRVKPEQERRPTVAQGAMTRRVRTQEVCP